MNMNIVEIIKQSPLILTECAISERLRRMSDVQLHPVLFNSPLIYDDAGRIRLTEVYSEYRNIALKAKLPILLCAPTWRLDRERIESTGICPSLNKDAVTFMLELKEQWQQPHSPLLTGALLAPKNDCYSPAAALDRNDARNFHSWQIDQLVESGVEIIIAQTFPALSEACGLADALSKTDIPYIISFVINRFSLILDGTPLAEAIAVIDQTVVRKPLGYMVNCVYPTFICPDRQPAEIFRRLLGIQANASSKDHGQLDGSETLQQDPLPDWRDQMLILNKRYGVKILGGCCGTDGTYLRSLTDTTTL